MVSLAGILGCAPPAEDATNTGGVSGGATDVTSTGQPDDGSGSTTGDSQNGTWSSSSESSGSGESGAEPECLDGEPSGVRVTAFDCEPCTGSKANGAGAPQWLVARIELPSTPYRVDALSVVIDGPSPTDLVYFVGGSIVPDPEVVLNTLQVEHAGRLGLPQMVMATLESPLTIGESEHLFVGLYLDTETSLRNCDELNTGDPKLWFLHDPPTTPWTSLGGAQAQIQVYGGPE